MIFISIPEKRVLPSGFPSVLGPHAGHSQELGAGGLNTYYRPVLEALYRFEYHLFGPHPFGFHFFNVLVHIVNGLLLFGLLKRLGLREAAAWVIACIFLIHPVQKQDIILLHTEMLYLLLLIFIGIPILLLTILQETTQAKRVKAIEISGK